MKKIILILVLIGVIMLNPARAIVQNSVGNIIYRGNVVTGTVAKDNGNGSYDVYIGESDVAYPKIFTLSRNPDLEVGDKVRILYENGNKEMPIILPPTTIGNFIFVVYQNGGSFYLNRYTYAGVLNAELGILSEISGTCYKVLVDSSQNVYILSATSPPFISLILYKYDSGGNFIKSKVLNSDFTNYEYYTAIGPDGYFYGLVSNTNTIRKRNLSDLEISNTYTLTAGHRYYYLNFDNDGKAYLYDKDKPRAYVKWKIGTGEESYHSQVNAASSYDSWVVAGDYIGCSASQFFWTAYTIAKNMSANRAEWTLNDISTHYKMTSIPNYFICLGKDSGGKLIIEKYTSERVRQWKTEVATSFTTNLQYCGIGAYSF